ncbi:TonB-dependent receptor [Pedobacter sp. UYP30]|uniref:TonB-dependent receptor n=1 Tax=Pedobacter sp. UYP30 TaxID=1756400 RepID=UPI003396837C
MKLTSIMIVLFLLQARAKTSAQNVTLEVKNVKLEEVLVVIQQQTGYDFLYDEQLLHIAGPITLKVSHVPINQVLDRCFVNQNISYVINAENKTIKLRAKVHAQAIVNTPPIKISGKVTDDKGLSVPGVSIKIKNTKLGAVTDASGNFSINVPDENAVLVVSSVGYISQEVTVGKRTHIDIKILEDPGKLNDVIVVGYGTQKKSEQTAAISSISGSAIAKSPVSDITNTLVGQVPGIISRQTNGKPGDNSAAIYIRGRASSDASALIIVDGIERSSFGNIDPNEIESISVLKDASSTALFGIKGANGVIIVTTKKGKAGKTTVSYTGTVGVVSNTGIPPILDAYQSASLQNEGEENLIKYGIYPTTFKKTFTAEDLQIFKDGTGNPLLYPNVNWYKEVVRPSWLRTQHNLNFTGGSDFVKYFVSLGYSFDDGMYKDYKTPSNYKTTNSFTRYNYRSNLDFRLTKTTKFSVLLSGRLEHKYGLGGIQSNGGISGNGTEDIITRINALPAWGLPFFPQYNNPTTPEQQQLDDTYNHVQNFGLLGVNTFNPYALLTRSGYYIQDNNAFESIFVLNQQLDAITKGLNFKATFGYDANILSERAQRGVASGYEVDRATSTIKLVPGTYDDQLGPYQTSRNGYIKSNLQFSLNYNRSFGLNNVSIITVAQRELQGVTGANAPFANQGLVLSAKYNYSSKYFVELNGAYNGSENYPKNKRYGLFPAVSAGWTVSQENFMKDIKWIDFLKIRGSYGLIGFGGVGGRFLYLDAYKNGGGGPNDRSVSNPNNQVWFGNPNSATQNPVVYHSQFGNPFVTWEKSIKRDLGLELQLFKNLLNFTADIFDEDRYDILLGRNNTTSVIYGETLPKVNFGKNYNSGYEFSLDFKHSINQFTYGFNLQLTHAHNKYVKIDEAPSIPDYQKSTGRPINQYYGYQVIGFYQDLEDIKNSPASQVGTAVIPGDLKYQDMNGDGVINAQDKAPIGYTDIPEDVLGFQPTFNYKGFTLSALFQGAYKISSDLLNLQKGRLNYFAQMVNSWRSPADNNTAVWPVIKPSAFSNNPSYDLNSFIIQDASYTKLRNVELSYQFPTAIIQKLKLQGLRIFANGQNIYTWTNFRGLDPEALKAQSYPIPRIFSFGANVQF